MSGATTAPTGGPIAFLSDYGLDDEFVGVVHAILNRHAPGVPVVDISHNIASHDVRAGALMLWRAAPWAAPGVILGVVDPGVGGARRAIAITVSAGERTRPTALVGPDNGLLLPAARLLGTITGAVALPPATEPPGATFDGRDVFAPAAAALATGRPLADVGTPLDPATLEEIEVPRAVAHPGGVLEAEILWIDRFGNAQLGALPDEAPVTPKVRTGAGEVFIAPVVRSFDAIPSGSYALVVDSYGLLAICADRRPAAAELRLREGETVFLEPS